MVFSFAITANAKKPKVVWPKAVLTLKDGTVLNGYLQNDIHFMKKNIYFSETQNGKDVKYKIFVDGYLYKIISIDEDSGQDTFIVTKGSDVVKIEVAGDAKASNQFPTSDHGILFYFNFPSS